MLGEAREGGAVRLGGGGGRDRAASDRAARNPRAGSIRAISGCQDVGGFHPEKIANSKPPVHLVRLLYGGDGEYPHNLLIIKDPIEDGIRPCNMESIELFEAG
jgi:hypothetical protein